MNRKRKMTRPKMTKAARVARQDRKAQRTARREEREEEAAARRKIGAAGAGVARRNRIRRLIAADDLAVHEP